MQMSGKLAAELGRVVEELLKSGKQFEVADYARFAEQVARAFQASADEVAILAMDAQGKSLNFVVPEKLQKVGNIPLSSTTALAARTARDRRAEIINNFTTAKHITVFEAVPLSQQRGDPIQKIMSAPILEANKAIGVVQVSRKGKAVTSVGPDFTPADLNELVAVAAVLGRCLKTGAAAG
jgi:hypothetical protein